jgi:hypothetical protein
MICHYVSPCEISFKLSSGLSCGLQVILLSHFMVQPLSFVSYEIIFQ